MQPTLRAQADRALWDEKLVQKVLPELEIVHQFCTATNWYCVWGCFENERLLKEHNAAGHKVRQIKFIELPSANHFVSNDLTRHTRLIYVSFRCIGMTPKRTWMLF